MADSVDTPTLPETKAMSLVGVIDELGRIRMMVDCVALAIGRIDDGQDADSVAHVANAVADRLLAVIARLDAIRQADAGGRSMTAQSASGGRTGRSVPGEGLGAETRPSPSLSPETAGNASGGLAPAMPCLFAETEARLIAALAEADVAGLESIRHGITTLTNITAAFSCQPRFSRNSPAGRYLDALALLLSSSCGAVVSRIEAIEPRTPREAEARLRSLMAEALEGCERSTDVLKLAGQLWRYVDDA